tara:strand:- start:110 stop:712 length:603 start_codon:yes stop_codon:yes gene_type:complete
MSDAIEAKTISVMIVDDHPMVAEGIQSILESYDDIHVVGCLCNGRTAIDSFENLNPDVILMDLNMPELGGLSATEIMLERRPDTRIVILSMHDNPEYISMALSHGAMGYILKDVPTDEIKLAIDTVMRGEKYLCTGAKGSLDPKPGTREPLTEREQRSFCNWHRENPTRSLHKTWIFRFARLKPTERTSSTSWEFRPQPA